MVRRARSGASQKDKLEALHDQLVDAVAELATSKGWSRMLAAAARFHDNSTSSILLICAQRPDATRVAGIRTWNTLGRRVNRGEHGIAILAPCVYRAPLGEAATADQRPEGPATTVETEPRDPVVDTDTSTRQLRGFKIVHVFDISQTDGEPLPEVEAAHLTGAEPDELWDHLAGLIQVDGYQIQRGPCGFTDHGSSLACRGQAEVEAESIAYLIAAQTGLDSTPYIVRWSGGDISLLRQSMATVVTAARAASPNHRVQPGPITFGAFVSENHFGLSPASTTAPGEWQASR